MSQDSILRRHRNVGLLLGETPADGGPVEAGALVVGEGETWVTAHVVGTCESDGTNVGAGGEGGGSGGGVAPGDSTCAIDYPRQFYGLV